MGTSASEPIRVLYVDDEPGLGDVVSAHLERHHDDIGVTTERSAVEALDTLAKATFDCIVSDHDMPEMNGLEFLRTVREDYPDLPFILFTGKGSEEIASDAISAGVTDYLQKRTGTDQYAVLANRIERAVEETRAKTALEERERQLSTLISNLPGIAYRSYNVHGWPKEFVSEGCEELLGYTADQLERGDITYEHDVVHPDDRTEVRHRVDEQIESGEPFELTYRVVTADGDTRWVWERGRAVGTDDGNVVLEGFITDVTERKQRESEAEAARKRYRSLVEAAPDALVLADAETGEIVDVNEAAEELLGRSADDLVGRPQTDIHPQEEAERYRRLFEEHVEQGTAVDHLLPDDQRVHVETADGEHVPVEISANVVEIDDRTLVQGFLRDLSNRRERERELERYRTLVENVGDPMYFLDDEGTVVMVNEAMADHLGRPREEIVGSDPEEFMPEEDVRKGTELIQQLLEDDDREWATFEIETRGVDDERTVNEDKIAVIEENGEFVGSVGVIRDISERKRRERELERYETIVQAVGDPVYTLDADGTFTFINDVIEQLAGHDPDDLVGEHSSVLLDDADVREGERLIRDLLQDDDRRYATYEMDVVTVDGRRIPCENRLALLPFEEEFRGTAGVVRDISERKQREKRLEQFASVVSHDLQNPLRVLRGEVELARDTDSEPRLGRMEKSIGRMEQLIDDLLTLARQGETVGETEPVDLASLAERAWRTVEPTGATLEVVGDGTVEADPERLLELYENLFVNAVEHGSTGSRAGSDDAVEHGSTGSQTASDDAVRRGSHDVTVTVGPLENGFYVEDDGPGIPQTQREDVFDHGYTTSEDGTGFGLSIVENIVDAHGWDVTVTDGDDSGARFEITGVEKA